LFDLWGDGKTILNGVYRALQPFGATLSNIRIEGSGPADQHVSVSVGPTTQVFRFDRVETTFINPTDQVFDKIPSILGDSLGWVRAACPDIPVAAHQASHLTHSKLSEETLEQVLSRIGPTAPKIGGQTQGSGAIFHWKVPEHQWVTQLTIDRSVGIQNGLFVMLSINAPVDKIDYRELLEAGRKYLLQVLAELGLNIPSFN
jgi:hypothetical protein